FEAATIRRMGAHLEQLLEGMVASPEQSIIETQLLTEAERQQLLYEWNETSRPYPEHETAHGLIEAQAASRPHAAALVYEGEQLSYEELNRRANQLAHHLLRKGLSPESIVGICLERSFEMVVGVLAVLKAGGAYVPL